MRRNVQFSANVKRVKLVAIANLSGGTYLVQRGQFRQVTMVNVAHFQACEIKMPPQRKSN
jgi:hypothetical protein